MVIGLIAKHGIDAMTIAYKVKEGLDAAANVPADVAKNIALAAAGAPSALAIFNALVRIMIGPLADKIGTKKIFVTLFTHSGYCHAAAFPGRKDRRDVGRCCRSDRLELRRHVHPVSFDPA